MEKLAFFPVSGELPCCSSSVPKQNFSRFQHSFVDLVFNYNSYWKKIIGLIFSAECSPKCRLVPRHSYFVIKDKNND